MAYLYTRKQVNTPIKSNDLLNIAFNDVEYYSYISSQGPSLTKLQHYCYDLKDVLQCDAHEVYESFLLFVTTYKPDIKELKNACFVLRNINHGFNGIFRRFYEACCYLEIETNIPKSISKFKYDSCFASITINKIDNKYYIIECDL